MKHVFPRFLSSTIPRLWPGPKLSLIFYSSYIVTRRSSCPAAYFSSSNDPYLITSDFSATLRAKIKSGLDRLGSSTKIISSPSSVKGSSSMSIFQSEGSDGVTQVPVLT
jgi:hypothetical protein